MNANFHLQVVYELTPNAQIWPRALNSTLGGDESKIYLVVADLGSDVGQGLDFISASPSPPISTSSLVAPYPPSWVVATPHI